MTNMDKSTSSTATHFISKLTIIIIIIIISNNKW